MERSFKTEVEALTLGVHVETCTNEAAAAAMLGASINYPLRGAVTWKSIGDTHRRGSANYARIEIAVIAPVLAGRISADCASDAIASARAAALADPDGEALARCLAEIDLRLFRPIAAE